MPVAELQQRMSSKEFTAWQAFIEVMPPEEGDYYRTGIVASTIVNMLRDPKKSKAVSPKDFMPDYDEGPKEEQTTEQKLHIVEMMNKAFKGKDLRK